VKVDKTLVASVALHVLVIGWGLISFSARSLEAPPPESMPVDIISADQLSKITAGIKSGEKDKPKPLVEKIADARPVDDAVGKITEKKEIVTASAPEPPPKPGGKAGREKARSAKTGCRGQAQGRAESRSRRSRIRPRSIRSRKP
jgi:hypothetical protein